MDVKGNVFVILCLSLALTACQKSSLNSKDVSGESSQSSKTLVAGDVARIDGPQNAMVGYAAYFELALPEGILLSNAVWTFGDNSAAQNTTGIASRNYGRPGRYTVEVTYTDTSGLVNTLAHVVNVLPIQDGLQCVADLAINSPDHATTGIPVDITLMIPSCLASSISQVSLNFGDGSSGRNPNAQHVFTTPGNYLLSADIYLDGSTDKYVTITTTIIVLDPVIVAPTPAPTPVLPPVVDPTPVATPVATPTPVPTAIPTPAATPTPVPNPVITYSYVASDVWGACSADCGGQQTRTSRCRSSAGDVVADSFCAGMVKSSESRICDGNPAAAAHSEQVVTTEDAGASNKCPSNQIGVIISERDKIVTSNYACIEHVVKLANVATTYSAWKTESYCRDFVAYRCSQDSLSNQQAQGRYEWMMKCQSSVPVIADFLKNFDDVKAKKGNVTLTIDPTNPNAQHLYPTFMNRATSPEKVWKAPIVKNASCEVPATVYVAAVCVSSCATPEQQIMAEIKNGRQMKYTTFVEALTQNLPKVATLASVESMNSKQIARTSVQQWVTELIDTDHVIIEFKLKSGRILKLTTNHPVVASDGSMKLAGEFKVGDSLVQLGGHLDEIISADRIAYFGKVYNLFTDSAEIHKNIVITNGYLNGTAYFQNQGAKDMNRGLFKNKLTVGIFN
ncbi:MAG: hypothetical protein H7326_01105 [Bdellovibrionaceae bacterium]|nr:hypothetical protein [Pseudobdellovibrionaceae bacterium]